MRSINVSHECRSSSKITLTAVVSRASQGALRVREAVRKTAERFMRMAPQPFTLENLYSYIHRIIILHRRSESHNAWAHGRYGLTARRLEKVSAEPSMKRPAGVTIIAITTFAGAAILGLGSFAFFFIAVMAISGGDGGDPGVRPDCRDASRHPKDFSLSG